MNAVFTAMTQSKGGLKPIDHYLRKPDDRRRTPAELHETLRRMKAAGVPMTIRRVTRH